MKRGKQFIRFAWYDFDEARKCAAMIFAPNLFSLTFYPEFINGKETGRYILDVYEQIEK